MTIRIAGVRAWAVDSHAHYGERADLSLMELAAGSSISVLSTMNAAAAAPVLVTRRHLAQSGTAPLAEKMFWLINAGNANAATGPTGLADAQTCCGTLARLTEVGSAQVLPFSTGIIGERIKLERLTAALPELYAGLTETGWEQAAAGIMTTDSRAKTATVGCEIDGRKVRLAGIAKGAAMLKPNMATMLAFAATDAPIQPKLLQAIHRQVTDDTFNRICVEGDTSTNDCVALAATGRAAGVSEITAGEAQRRFARALHSLYAGLAEQMMRDAEGASRLIRIDVTGGKDRPECNLAADTVARCVLLKTALAAGDPNWGRILMALGYSGIDRLNMDSVSVWFGELPVFTGGSPAANYSEKEAGLLLAKSEISIRIDLGRGQAGSHALTCDLTAEYVRLNSEYRT